MKPYLIKKYHIKDILQKNPMNSMSNHYFTTEINMHELLIRAFLTLAVISVAGVTIVVIWRN